jgi:hypothetical protein
MRLAVFSVLLAGGPILSTLAAEQLTLDPTSLTTEWSVSYQGRQVLVYAFAPGKFKPYVKALATIKGDNILRDAPFDHLHHHALMYGIRVNGLNFWEETSGCGIQKPVQTAKPELGANAQGAPTATLKQTIHWLAPADAWLPDTTKAALLIEQRTLTLTVNEARQEVALLWRSAFEVGTRTNQATLTGANYHGLGMRFLQELDTYAAHLNSTGAPDLSGGKQDVSQAKWGAVLFKRPNNPVTVVLMGSPGNGRGDAWFFTMRQAFPYLAATQHLDQEPLVYRAGDKFAVDYLVAVYPEIKTAQALQQRSEQWAQQSQ